MILKKLFQRLKCFVSVIRGGRTKIIKAKKQTTKKQPTNKQKKTPKNTKTKQPKTKTTESFWNGNSEQNTSYVC